MGKGWLGASLIKKRLCKVQKIDGRNAREPCGEGSRGRLSAPVGFRGKASGEGPGSKAPGSSPFP